LAGLFFAYYRHIVDRHRIGHSCHVVVIVVRILVVVVAIGVLVVVVGVHIAWPVIPTAISSTIPGAASIAAIAVHPHRLESSSGLAIERASTMYTK